MLELRNIVKDYVNGNNVTHALKGVSVTFRKNEFVSILGASGCGKTTLLNIIGGLDRYTKGDLLILGKSTKDFKDRDWDTYRNHSIGFVFQTYNLISHQNILKNVELALTISGVSKEERRTRAYSALKRVGLEGMEKKKPNQLSGGQCQRVAIARALINNPEILLADEPTGALDSETSIQIMDLLKEVASDRLVIMVTHNPELAEKYSTRIINMHDGLLIKDSNPFEYDSRKEVTAERKEIEKTAPSKGKKKKTSMSILTSMGLSTSNLLSKMKRTVLVTIAGSIGIIGVSAVLAVSRGVKDYIADMENDMLSNYPVTVEEESVDYTSLMTGLSNREVKEKFKFDPENPAVGINSMIEYLMNTYTDITKVKTNYIDDNMLEYINDLPSDAAAVIKYDYGIDVTNNIFGDWKENKDAEPKRYSLNGLTQSYIQELKTVDGFDEYATFVNLFTNFMKELPNDKEYILDQYDIIGGDKSDLSLAKDELIFVVDKDTTLTDLILAEMGIFNHDEFLNIAIRAIETQKIRNNDELSEAEKDAAIKEIEKDTYYTPEFKFGELLNRKYTYYPQDKIYTNSVIQTDRIIANLVSPSVFPIVSLEFDVFSDMLIGELRDSSDIKSLLSPYKLKFTRTVPTTETDLILKTAGTWTATYENEDGVTTDYTLQITKNLPIAQFKINDGAFTNLVNVSGTGQPQVFGYEKFKGYCYNAEVQSSYGEGEELHVAKILKLKEDKQFGCLSSGIYYSNEFAKHFIADSNKSESDVTNALKDHIGSIEEKTAAFDAYVQFDFKDHRKKDAEGNPIIQTTCASSLNGSAATSITDVFATFAGSNNISEDTVHLRSLAGLKTNLAYIDGEDEIDKANTTFELIPKAIEIYPASFEAKDKVTTHLDKWNDDGPLAIEKDGKTVYVAKEDRPELSYTDTIELIVALIDTFINAITIALVVFTSLSLVVSCFMIAVVTYISIVERIKEIGVIRSVGGRKIDVAGLFVMETFLTGLFSGVFGITMTYILQVIINIWLKGAYGIAIMNLTIPTALLMIGISIALSVLSGLIPSQSAAHKDPVVALRSNE